MLPREPGKASFCILLLLLQMYVVSDLPSLYGSVSSPETAAGNVAICFLSSTGGENREYLLQNSDIGPHYYCHQNVARMFAYKNKRAPTAWRSLSHIAEQPGHFGLHLLLVLVWCCFMSLSAMHSLVYHSLTCLSTSQQTASPNQHNVAAEHPRR